MWKGGKTNLYIIICVVIWEENGINFPRTMVSRVNGPFFIDHAIIKIYNDKIIKIGCFLISLFALIGPYYMDPKSGSSSSIYKIL